MSGCHRTRGLLRDAEDLDAASREHLTSCPSCQHELRQVQEIVTDLGSLRECFAAGATEVEKVAGAVRTRTRRTRGRRAVFASLSLALGTVSAAFLLWLVPAPLPAGAEERLVALADDVAPLVTPSLPSDQVPYELVATGSGFLVEDDEDEAGDWPGGFGVLAEVLESEYGNLVSQ